MVTLYHLRVDDLIDIDFDVKELEEVIEKTSEETQNKVDWTKLWGKNYPVLTTYQQEVQVETYAESLKVLLKRLRDDYHYSDVDACLVLKDILSYVWKDKK